jgi:hypothetical protein
MSKQPLENIWQELYRQSDKLTRPTSKDQLLLEENCEQIKESIKDAFLYFLENGELHKGIKVYIDGVLKSGMAEKMSLSKPSSEESLEQWAKRFFGEKRFGLIFNSLESYNNQLPAQMVSQIKPLLDTAGLPLGGISFLFFMGNYGFTPFGIHKEAIGEDGFLFHLGPASKTFYTWDTPEYNGMEHNTIVFKEVEKMLPDAESYVLKPGSVMFIPNDVYHVANTETFSLSLVMDFINPSQEELEIQLAAEIAAEKSTSKASSYLRTASMETNKVDWIEWIEAERVERLYQKALERKYLRLKSNIGILQPALKEKSTSIPNADFSIRLYSDFQLYLYCSLKDEWYVMARGHEIPVKPHSVLLKLLDRLNEGEQISFKDFKEVLENEWDITDIYGFVSNLSVSAVAELI